MTRQERFFSKVSVTPTCWNWTAETRNGYGQFWNGARLVNAHRWSYQVMLGDIPDGLHIDHLCGNRGCVNPFHLEPVKQAENNRRAKANRNNCKRGHEYTTKNTVNYGDGRQCRACNRLRANKTYAKKQGGTKDALLAMVR